MTAYGKLIDAQPSGAIVIWSGLLSDIPLGWKLCDGTNGTPDLREKFCKCVPTVGTNPGATGGEKEHTLTISEMPNHNHPATEGGGHNHPDKFGINWSTVFPRISNQSGVATTDPFFKFIPSGDGANTFDQNVSTAPPISATVDSVGGDVPHNNEPEYFEALFIQKE